MRDRYLGPLLLLFIMSVPCAAQIGGADHVITGTVRDATSLEPLPGVRVRLLFGGEELAAPPTSSSTEGQFQFECRKTDYFILAEKDGYAPARLRISVNPGPETRITLDLVRESSNDGSAAGPAEAVSAHQLSVPEKARMEFGQGLTLLNSKKDYLAAIHRFEAAIHSCPSYYEAYAEMGVADYYGGDASAAEQAFRKSIELSSGKYTYAISNLAELLNNTKRFADAEPVAREAIEVDNSSSRAYFELARAQFGLKRPADAEQSAAKARDLNPEYPLVYIVLADIHLALHNYTSVLQDADAYLKLVPDSPLSAQVRKTRQQVARVLERTQAPSAAMMRSH